MNPRPAPPLSAAASQDDAALVAAARDGEASARRELFERHVAMVNRLAFVLLGRDDELDDLVQDVFVEALSSLGRLREPGAFPAWLRRLTVQTSWTFVRRRRLRERLGLGRGDRPDAVEGLLSPTATPETLAELRSMFRAVERLPSALRMVLLLRRVEGLQLEEIAALTASSLATVKRRLTKAESMIKREGGTWARS
jgi:RNA polymerase sigma-70 factor (ECF subfamily)